MRVFRVGLWGGWMDARFARLVGLGYVFIFEDLGCLMDKLSDWRISLSHWMEWRPWAWRNGESRTRRVCYSTDVVSWDVSGTVQLFKYLIWEVFALSRIVPALLSILLKGSCLVVTSDDVDSACISDLVVRCGLCKGWLCATVMELHYLKHSSCW